MDHSVDEIKRRIAGLPAGSLGKKTVGGRTYWYRRWQEDGKRREKYVPARELDEVRTLIEERKALEAELRLLREGVPPQPARSVWPTSPALRTNVLLGQTLLRHAEGAAGLHRRTCFARLWDYLTGPRQDRVLVLCGLRRTGKTTLIRQALLHMDEAMRARSAFVQVTPRDTLADINADLKALRDAGFEYVFVDEATLMEDFIEGAALFSDVFAAGGMRIVLSGTDSLGFLFAEDDQLYDRCTMIHTTLIPYREFNRVLGIEGIDDYIRYGGTMSMGGQNYNESSTFASAKDASEYVDSAIARNIQHSLRLYQYGGHFRSLQTLFEANELTSAINRVVEDVNHRFAVDVLTRAFRSHDLGLSARNLRNDRENPTDILDRVDKVGVTVRLAESLEILDRERQSVQIDSAHVREIREYLDLLDITHDVDLLDASDPSSVGKRTVVAQPGLRWAQADALVKSLLLDPIFATLSLVERNRVLARMRSEVMGRMLEDIVLLETKLARPKCHVFKLQFAMGEFDMVVADPASATCEVFEIKHSDKRDPKQYRHLMDREKCAATEFRFGSITRKVVLYRGEDHREGEVSYVNAESYLLSLPDSQEGRA